ncbi:sensor histidine kinase [Dactylosporangium matsuzakiense]|uniref:histidine kinase n=1 Tax=Dactylosporangium matsuzakiense TaxID=53360 RepID=A0A9W6KKP3_9ACTN|nr:histidine kinase [Dactylosporangium matsuzakiense]UWZ41626.1 hypothetical protein Dmats_28715 [Dactylosporangium matsuzakiense]GLL02299.1 hypothetical protein GCM10017581_040410 [Dactylosporangium matsuzakiense]
MRRRAIDWLIALLCAVTTAGPAMDSTLFGGSPYGGWRCGPAILVPLAALTGVAALMRRRRPLLFAAAAGLAWVVAAAYPAVVAATFTLGAHGRPRRSAGAAVAVVTAAVAIPFRREGMDAVIPLSVAVCVAPALLGLWLAGRRDALTGLRERAERAEREAVLLADQARAEERARIAHDMHDVVTHRIGLMVLHATALEVAAPADRPPIARRIGTIGREALGELRALVGVLHNDRSPPLAPSPTLADLARLAAESRAAGTAVRLSTAGPQRPLPALVEQAAYRVVQEALTNVRTHAPATSAGVHLRYSRDHLTITVTNTSPEPGVAEPAARPTRPRASADGGSGPAADDQAGRGPGAAGTGRDGGFGLIGLRERVRLLGGTLTAGPAPDGRFVLSATIPVPPADPGAPATSEPVAEGLPVGQEPSAASGSSAAGRPLPRSEPPENEPPGGGGQPDSSEAPAREGPPPERGPAATDDAPAGSGA